ncbi:MAG: arylesterase [Methylophilaceae bacterium]|nr:arylesterase [Methylophilaceae bacterium]
MKHIFWLLLLALLAACSAPRHAPIPAGATVLVLGDSLSYGTGAAAGEDYPTLLASRTGWNVINAGVPGDTTEGGLKRLPDLLEAHAPQLLLVELGGNDFLRRVPLPQIRNNLKAILAQARVHGVPAVLVAVPRPNLFGAALRSLSDDPLYAELAAETHTPLIADVLSDTLSKNELKADPLHPNAEGYRKIADDMVDALKELGFLR